MAEVKENAFRKVKNAFEIEEDYVPGQAFDFESQEKKRLQKLYSKEMKVMNDLVAERDKEKQLKVEKKQRKKDKYEEKRRLKKEAKRKTLSLNKKEDEHELNKLLNEKSKKVTTSSSALDSKKIIRSLLHILITLLHRYKAQGYDKLQLSAYLKEFMRFQDLIEKDYFKTKKVLDYANKLGFSTKKLNTIVKFIANKPAKDFIDETVIVKIKRLLLHSNFSVKEIAFKVGFNDPANLYKYFKKNANSTPDAFRKKYIV